MNVKSVCLATAFTATSAFAAFANMIPDGEYTGPGDGSRVTMVVTGDTVKLITVGTASTCSGGGEGPISQVSDEAWRIVLQDYGQCIVDVSANSQGYSLNAHFDGDCIAYSGQACGFSANVSK